MENDDQPIGRVLTRREALLLLGATGVMMLTRCAGSGAPPARQEAALPGCVVRPEQTEGPYFVDEMLNRSDIRAEPADGTVKPGVPLHVEFHVSRLAAAACTPLAGAVVDVWHCDAAGVYSGVEDPQFNTVGKQYLRGFQVTDAEGVARFTTIYPGWYPGRAVHIHFKIRSAPTQSPGFDFTSQLYFADDVTDLIYARAPYASRGPRSHRNEQDVIFPRGGPELTLALRPDGEGYAGAFDIALQTV